MPWSGAKATSVALQLLVAVLIGTQTVFAKHPPDESICMKEEMSVPKEIAQEVANFIGVPSCRKHYWYCPERAELKWSEWLPVSGSEIVGGPEGGTIGKSIAHTVTQGTMHGVDLGFNIAQFGQIIKKTKALELLTAALGGSYMWTQSKAETGTTTITENCPAGVRCGLVLQELRLVVHGRTYAEAKPWPENNLLGKIMNCSPEEEEVAKVDDKPFSVYYPALVKKATQDPAKIRHDICYFDGPGGTGGIKIKCPEDTTVVTNGPPKPIDGKAPPDEIKPPGPAPDPNKAPPPSPGNNVPQPPKPEEREDCYIGETKGYCEDKKVCAGIPERTPVYGEKGPNGKFPCTGPNSQQCCIPKKAAPSQSNPSAQPPPPEKEECFIGKTKGYCEDKNVCEGTPDRKPVYGKKVDGKFPCTGPDSRQCCVPKNAPQPPPQSSPPEKEECFIGKTKGYCEDKKVCEGIPDRKPVYGEKGRDGKFPCTGPDSRQCCIPKNPTPPANVPHKKRAPPPPLPDTPPPCRVGGQQGACLPAGACPLQPIAKPDGKSPCRGPGKPQCCPVISV